jgi:hypothetical protein
MTHPCCIAYRADGSLCREPATILDLQLWRAIPPWQRGGMVCWRHDPGLSLLQRRMLAWLLATTDRPRRLDRPPAGTDGPDVTDEA